MRIRLANGHPEAKRSLPEDIPWAKALPAAARCRIRSRRPRGGVPASLGREKHTRGHGAGTRARNSRGRLSNPLTIVLARRKIRRPTGGGPKQAV